MLLFSNFFPLTEEIFQKVVKSFVLNRIFPQSRKKKINEGRKTFCHVLKNAENSIGILFINKENSFRFRIAPKITSADFKPLRFKMRKTSSYQKVSELLISAVENTVLYSTVGS